MPRSCVVGGCDRTARKNPDLVLFRFPRDKKRLHRAWTKFVQTTRAHFKPSQWLLICQKHFPEGSLDESSVLQKELGFRKPLRAKCGTIPTKRAPSTWSPRPSRKSSSCSPRSGDAAAAISHQTTGTTTSPARSAHWAATIITA